MAIDKVGDAQPGKKQTVIGFLVELRQDGMGFIARLRDESETTVFVRIPPKVGKGLALKKMMVVSGHLMENTSGKRWLKADKVQCFDESSELSDSNAAEWQAHDERNSQKEEMVNEFRKNSNKRSSKGE